MTGKLVDGLRAAHQKMLELLATSDRGRLIRDGATIAIAGKPNVGKSSLFNALLRENRAIVTPQAGTTRDRLEEYVTIAGVPVKLVDTAGLREAGDDIERIGVEVAREAMRNAHAVLFVVDASEALSQEDRALAVELGQLDLPIIQIWNKVDLIAGSATAALAGETTVADQQGLSPASHRAGDCPRPEKHESGIKSRTVPPSQARELQSLRFLSASSSKGDSGGCSGAGGQLTPTFQPMTTCPVSALTGAGLPELEAALAKLLLGGININAGQAMLTRLHQKESLRRAADAVGRLFSHLDMSPEFLAIDLREALEALGEITGETTPDDLLETIFSSFCIGK